MNIHPLARLALLVGAMSIFARRDYAHLLASAVVALVLFVILGQVRLLFLFIRSIFLFLASAGLLWFFRFIDFSNPNFEQTWQLVLAPRSGFFCLLRIAVITSLIFLALRAITDGQYLPTLRRMGLPKQAAILAASAIVTVESVKTTLGQAYDALRAHGVIGPSRWSAVVHLHTLVRLTWTATLAVAFSRGELKWDRGGFLAYQQDRANNGPVQHSRTSTTLALFGAMTLIVANLLLTKRVGLAISSL